MGTESIRDSLEAASEALETAPEPSAGVEASTTPEPVQPEATSTPAPVAAEPSSGPARDASGKFAPKTTAGETAGQAAPTGVPPPPKTEGAASSTPKPGPTEQTQTPAPKPGEPDTTTPPGSWKLGERQEWEKVPPVARAAIHRRELEVQQMLSRTAPDRQVAADVRAAIAPIAQAIQARGTTPQKLIASYVQFDQALTSRDPAVQAHALAQVIKGYGVDISTLADALDGKLAGPQQHQPSVEEIREQVRAEEQAKYQQVRTQEDFRASVGRVQEFAKKADPALFNDDVRNDMADLIEVYARRGVELSLQDAYDRAIRANPESWAIVQQREEAKRAATQQQATQRAEAAAGSVKSRPASPVSGNSTGNSIRADLEAVAAGISGR